MLLGTATLTHAQLLKMETEGNVTYFINDTRYEIPWRYNPFNGSPDPGGGYFAIKTTWPTLSPQYAQKAQAPQAHRPVILTIAKSDLTDWKPSGSKLGEPCKDESNCGRRNIREGRNFNFQAGGAGYNITANQQYPAFHALTV